ncbi:MAG: fused response regulator/phosphatase [Rhodobacteraceae bacterium]|nr:fused response regulator/phosphatase [Paracoccaceae bacterium]
MRSTLASDPRPKFDADTKEQVLVIDDSALQRRILCSAVKRWGFDVLEAASGEEAVQLCKQAKPDVVLCDWMMPGMTGLEFCTIFREMTADRYGYFILLTSKSEKEDVAQGLQSGADDFLSKPVNNHELRARIASGQRILQMQRELTEKNAIITDTLSELQRLYDSLDNDLIEARKLQQSLVPDRYRSFSGGKLALTMRPSGHVGGDLVGYFEAGCDHLGIYALDVSGHGISSALMTARLAGLLSGAGPEHNVALLRNRDGTFRPRPPAESVEALNEMVLDQMETEHYFTILLAFVNQKTGEVMLSQAGHPHPVILRESGRIEQDGTGGFPVGLMSGVQFEETAFTLAPGDRLIFVSDGITECPNQAGDMLEEDGLAEMVARNADVAARDFFEALTWDLTDFAGQMNLPDDVSGVMFEYRGQSPDK